MGIVGRNKLQQIQKATYSNMEKIARGQIRVMNEWYADMLSSGKLTTIPFDTNLWLTGVESETVNAMIKGTDAGLSGLYSIANVQKTSEYYIGLKVDGVTLSETLRDSAKYASKLTRDAVNRHLKAKTTVKRLSQELTARNMSRGDLPRYLKELREALKEYGPDSAKFRKAIKTAENQVSQLAQDGAPTRDLQRAYSKVLKSAESADLSVFDRAMRTAIGAKAVYNNDRIARTELGRAYSKGFARQVANHPEYDNGNVYIFVRLSSRHPRVDECDYYAEVDSYGVGAGGYPQDEAPLIPFHPNCLCMYEIRVMYLDKRGVRSSQSRNDEYLSSLSDRDKRAVESGLARASDRKLTPLPASQIE